MHFNANFLKKFVRPSVTQKEEIGVISKRLCAWVYVLSYSMWWILCTIIESLVLHTGFQSSLLLLFLLFKRCFNILFRSKVWLCFYIYIFTFKFLNKSIHTCWNYSEKKIKKSFWINILFMKFLYIN